ncbi:MAG: DEAD/DEAH box helicase family protein [Aquabacterium sp.]|nr:DEAD/DEAH box helicase family protein [Aquabacterium sp.]
MPTLELKHYQTQALAALERYLRRAAALGAAGAYIECTGYGYNPEPFGELPCVCLRIPTGGGKTLLAAHAVALLAREWPGRHPQPLALWLVPTDTIRSQTLKALSTPGHPFRTALAQACGDDVVVCELEALSQLSPQDFDQRAVVVVATIQSFRVEDTDQRNVYAFSETFEPHFRGVPAAALQGLHGLPDALVTEADVAAAGPGHKAGREMLARFVGQPRWSLANWLALRQPYVIVDEAHTTKTERSFEALKRLNPALILELTATPVPKRSNVLFHVSAQQLQAEHMIKMPITLVEHTRGWQAAVLDAVQTQRLLEVEAQQEEAANGSHIRPIVLLQAQNQGEPVDVDVLRAYLVNDLLIPEAQVKVATGTRREIEGIDLAARECAVRYIITVQALGVGWDCPFAYVLCSVQTIRSGTAIEQLLGRVLRMPYAKQRTRPALNRAYAHVTEATTGAAANALADRLIDGMGFDPLDMASMIAPQLPLALAGGEGGTRDDGPLFATPSSAVPLPTLTVDVPADKPLPAAVAEAVAAGLVEVSSDGERQRVRVQGHVGDALAEALVQAQARKAREGVQQQVQRHNALVAGAQAPASRGEAFAAVPRLAYRVTGGPGEQQPLALLEVESARETVALNLLAAPIAIDGFTMVEQGTQWELYLEGDQYKRITVGPGQQTQLNLDAVETTVHPEDLARWLAEQLQHPSRNVARDVMPAHLRAFALACVNHLMHDKGVPLAQLVRHQHPLVQRLALRVDELREAAGRTAFRQLVLDGGWELQADASFEFHFDPHAYPVPGNKRYSGKFRMAKHFYPVVADLEDGSEEMLCALAIDGHPKVRRWVRNLDSEPVHAFWLPTSFGRFYPDFVCELDDGRVLVAEYKGEHLRTVPKEIEKGQVGRLWAGRSDGRAVFAMLFKQHGGMSVAQQLDAVVQ